MIIRLVLILRNIFCCTRRPQNNQRLKSKTLYIVSSLGKRSYGAQGYRYGRRATTVRFGMKPSRRALSLNRGPGRGFKSNFFRLQRAPGMSRELGYVDLALTGFNFDTTGSIVLLNTVAQGASVNQRVGKRSA